MVRRLYVVKDEHRRGATRARLVALDSEDESSTATTPATHDSSEVDTKVLTG